MKILTFDTSLNKTYITFGEDENIIISKAISSNEEKYHSAFLVPEIINILKSQNMTMKDIDAIGINEGPGSFTGIRICTVIARTAAQQLGIKIVPVPSLEILSKINNSSKKSLVVLDARKQKVYIAGYDKSNQIISPKSVCIEDLVDIISTDDWQIITDSAVHKMLQDENIESINYEADEYELGRYLYNIVYEKINYDHNDFYWAKAKPLYIQPPSITISKKAGL